MSARRPTRSVGWPPLRRGRREVLRPRHRRAARQPRPGPVTVALPDRIEAVFCDVGGPIYSDDNFADAVRRGLDEIRTEQGARAGRADFDRIYNRGRAAQSGSLRRALATELLGDESYRDELHRRLAPYWTHPEGTVYRTPRDVPAAARPVRLAIVANQEAATVDALTRRLRAFRRRLGHLRGRRPREAEPRVLEWARGVRDDGRAHRPHREPARHRRPPRRALGIGTIWVLRGEAPPSRHPSRWPRPTSPFRTSPRSPTSSSNAPRHDHTHARHRPRHRLRPLCRPRHGHGKRCRAGGFGPSTTRARAGRRLAPEPDVCAVALGLVRQVCQQLGPDACRVAAVSVTGTSGTVVPVDWNGRRSVPLALRRHLERRCPRRSRCRGRLALGRMLALRREFPGLGGPRRPTSSTPPWPVVPCLPTPRTGSRPGSTSPLGIGRSTRWRRSDSTGPTRDSCPSSSSPAPRRHRRPGGRPRPGRC